MRGHIRQRGSSWELRAYAGVDPLTGRHKYVTRSHRGGRREAEEALARLITEVSGGGHAAQDTTLATLIHQWFELAKPELSPTTAREYDRIIERNILPALGTVRLARLKPAQLDRFYAQLRERGGQNGRPLSPATVRQVHAIIRRALHQGLRWGWITANPAALASPPRVRRAELAPPDPAGVIALIETATAADPDFGCFLHLAATTGARRGELCALRWKDVELRTGTVTIARAIVKPAHGQLLEKDTKTHASRRIALDPGSVAVLTAHRQRADDRAGACGVRCCHESYVFSREPDSSVPWTPDDATKEFIRFRKRAGLPSVRLHDLRHFAATRLLAAGVPVRTVSGRLGHANAATTLGVYAHFVEESDREAAATLGALITRPPAAPRRQAKAR